MTDECGTAPHKQVGNYTLIYLPEVFFEIGYCRIKTGITIRKVYIIVKWTKFRKFGSFNVVYHRKEIGFVSLLADFVSFIKTKNICWVFVVFIINFGSKTLLKICKLVKSGHLQLKVVCD